MVQYTNPAVFMNEFPTLLGRLMRIHQNGNKLKKSLVSVLTMATAEFGIRLGLDELVEQSSTKTMARHSCVFSTLPTWEDPLYYGGVPVVRVEASMFNWIPHLIFISHREDIHGTFAVDPERMSNAHIVFDGMLEELQRQTMEMDCNLKSQQS